MKQSLPNTHVFPKEVQILNIIETQSKFMLRFEFYLDHT